MKTIKKFKWVLALLCIILNTKSILAQSKEDIFDKKVPVIWLGLDYSQARLINPTTVNKNYQEVTNAAFIKTYVPAWNYLFIIEPKKYDVAKAIHRDSVDYALDVTEKANKGISITKDIFTHNTSYKLLTEQNISDLVNNYDFQGKTGIGLLFFIEEMSTVDANEGAWVTFVDMKSKTVLLTMYLKGKTGGMGFRNNWADATFHILQQLGSDKRWINKTP